MSATDVAGTLTAIEHAAWIVDHAYMPQRPHVDDNGVVTPVEDPAPPRLAVEVIEEKIRPDKRGRKREGLTVRLFMILLIVAARHGRVQVKDLLTLALDGLPLEMQRDLGIQYWTNKNSTPQLRSLTGKQLYTLVDNIREHLDVDPELGLTPQQETERLALLDDIQDAFLYATHVLPLTGTSVAIDETGVWSWIKGGRKPENLPLIDPTDEDANLAAEERAKLEKAVTNALKHDPDVDEDDVRAEAIGAVPAIGTDEPEVLDEDDSDFVPATPSAGTDTPGQNTGNDGPTDDAEEQPKKKRGKRCWFAAWGVKTHKTGKRTSFYGYSLHALVRVPAVGAGKKRASKAERYREPNLIEEIAITPPAEDIVEPSLALVKKRLARNAPIEDLLGDRHYSYKKAERWAQPLWQLKVRPVLDLRENDHRPVDYEGAVILAGTPHCQPPQHLWRLPRPGKGAPKAEFDAHAKAIAERQKYALKRHKTAWSANGRGPGGDSTTRWLCPAAAGTVGCPRIEGSVEVARANGLPIITPPDMELKFCSGKPVSIEAGPHMKYQQEQYWGSPEWLLSWNRRTYVEGVFGNMKNYATGNIHRGYMQFTGRALVTLGLTAAVVAYNLRELENWHARASKHCPDNPLLRVYEQHPLHQPTKSGHGFTMLTQSQRAQWEHDWLRELTPAGQDADLPAAA
ncbi:MAG: hypothetical protein JWQ45_2917 [Blastococcus sp.]|nr:hypothetical protein [Blastococcus sp.]